MVIQYDASVTLGASCNQGWSLGGTVPSGGSLNSVTVSNASHAITLALNEGTDAPDTSVGSLVVNFNPAASCTLLGFSNLVPLDDAPPVVVSAVSGTPSGGTPGKMEPGDSIAITFSEPLDPSTVPANVTVTETRSTGNANDTLTIAGTSLNITHGTISLGSRTYFTGNTAGSAAYPANVTTDSATAPTVLTVTIPPTVLQNGVPVATPCVGVGCAFINPAGGVGNFVFDPAASLQSLAAAPSTVSTATTPTTMTTNPPPGSAFRMF